MLRCCERLGAVIGMVILANNGWGQVTLDGALGPARPLSGPNYAITADLGQQVGGNLFHSFGLFSIQTGELATFSGPNSVSNIIGRVTGGQVSFIDGALRSTISGANLYLLNPAGVLFGEHASLDVPGSVHVSTADYLKLGDGGRFDARTPSNSVLTVAPVEAFGFLGDAPGKIAINGSFLQVPEGQTLSLIGGDITLTNATVYAPAGRLNVAAVGSAGEVAPTENDLAMQGFDQLGTIALISSNMDTSGTHGGAVFVRGGRLVMNHGKISAHTSGSQSGHDIDIHISDRMDLKNSSEIITATTGDGNAGSITLSAERLIVSDGGSILTSTLGLGRAGDITISATKALIIEGYGADGYQSGIRTRSLGEHTGPGGNILITAPILTIDGGRVGSDTAGAGDAGHIELHVDQLSLTGGGSISAATLGSGQGGAITITATEAITISGHDSEDFSSTISSVTGTGGGSAGNILINTPMLAIARGGIGTSSGIRSYTFGAGDAGNIDLSVRRLSITGGGVISADTLGSGRGGAIRIIATDAIDISGRDTVGSSSGIGVSSLTQTAGPAGKILITTPMLIVNGGLISSDTSSNERAGRIDLHVGQLHLTGGGRILAGTLGAGRGGKIKIVAKTVTINGADADGFSSTLSTTAGESTGDAGNIYLTTAFLFVINGGQIHAATLGDGDGGEIHIVASEAVHITGVDAWGFPSLLLTSSLPPDSTATLEGIGNAGTIELTTPLLVLNSGFIQSNTSNKGNAGTISLDVDHLSLINGSQISAGTWGSGKGGDLIVHAGGTVLITGGMEIMGNFVRSGLFAISQSAGDAGNLTLTTPDLTLADGGVIKATSDQTTGGNLLINADHLKMFSGSQISSTASGNIPGSNGGNVTINSTNIVALDGSSITAKANQGLGGNITVNAEVFLHDAPSTADVLNASSQVIGNDGTVQLNAPTTDISGSLVALDPAYLDAAGQLSPRCGTGDLETRSRFIIQGRGALPLDPNDTAPAPVSRCGSERLELASTAGERTPGNVQPSASVAEPPASTAFGFSNR